VVIEGALAFWYIIHPVTTIDTQLKVTFPQVQLHALTMLLAVLERPDVYVFSISVHRSGPGPLLLIPIIGSLIDEFLTPKGLADVPNGES
jgi:hypothetical protein